MRRAGVHSRISRLLLRTNFRSPSSARYSCVQRAHAARSSARDHRRNGAQRLQEDHRCERARRERALPSLLAQSQLAVSHDYVVYIFEHPSHSGQAGRPPMKSHLPDSLYTGIWWYARFPNHYAGDGLVATVLGRAFASRRQLSGPNPN